MSVSLQARGRSPPGSSVHGILQAEILEWVAVSFSRGSSRLSDRTRVSCVSCTGRMIVTTEPPGKPQYSRSCEQASLLPYSLCQYRMAFSDFFTSCPSCLLGSNSLYFVLFFFFSSYFNLRFSDYWGLASRCLLTLLRSAWTWFLPSFLLGVLSFSYWHDTNMICMIYSVYSMYK